MREYSIDGNKPFCHDNMTIKVHSQTVEFVVGIDGTGNSFTIPKDTLNFLINSKKRLELL